MVALDAMEKAADVAVLQAELNDLLGVVIKITGDTSAVESALASAKTQVEGMGVEATCAVVNRPDAKAWPAIESPREFNPLIQQDVVFYPAQQAESKDRTMSSDNNAIGFIETQGFTAVIEAIDTACKAANVQVIGKEKLGGGYVTVVVRGDVAAVKAAVDAGRAKVESLGKLIAAHVIARPSASITALLPKP